MLAHYGNDKAFMDLIHKGYDIHKGTASLLFHVPYEEVTDDQRSKGKTTNFGLVYGLGNASFAKALGHDIDESIYRTATKYLYEKYRPWDIMQYREPVCYVMTAEQAIAELDEKIITRIAKEQKIEDVNKYREELIKAIEYFFSEPIKEAILDAQKTKNDYFNRFPGIKQFIKEAKDVASKRGYVKTWVGSRRHFRDPARQAYMAPNAIIQGGCGYVMKIKLVEVNNYLKSQGAKSYLFNSVHDEIGVMIFKDEQHLIPEINRLLADLPFRVPISWGVEWGYNWAEKQDYEEVVD